MNLREYLETNQIPAAVFAKKSGFSIHAIRKWLSGQRIPRSATAKKIYKVTNGAVDGDSWLTEPPPDE